MTVYGTQEHPSMTKEPMGVARFILEDLFTVEGLRGLHSVGTQFVEWYGGRWHQRSRQWMEDTCWLRLENLYVAVGPNSMERYSPTPSKVEGVVRALEALTRLPQERMPVWLGKEEDRPDMGRTIAFEDVLVDVGGGGCKVVPRDQRWLDLQLVPCNYDPEAKCPRWEQCLEEWSGGDAAWKELLMRWMGYCMMSHRDYAKLLLMTGVIRGGKGVISRMQKRLVGDAVFMGTDLTDLSSPFGLDGLDTARILCISEVSELDGKGGERCVQVLKNVLGNDPLRVNIKNVRQVRNVTAQAAPVLLSNEIPVLPNKGRGLSSKMLVLPFERSFEGKEDYGLESVLALEVAGIARMAVEAARRLEAETASQKKFVMPDASKDTIDSYHVLNNPYDAFLRARFVQSPQGFVINKIIVNEFLDWVTKNGVKTYVSRNLIAREIERHSSWGVKRDVFNNNRGLRGIALRKLQEDDV